MSNEPRLTIAGNNDLASETARHAMSSGTGDPVYLWRSTSDPLVSRVPVIVLADPEDRIEFVHAVLDAGVPAISLPLDVLDEQIEQAVADGRLKFLSRLHGLPTLSRLADDCREQSYGRRYGVFAAHRLPRNSVENIEDALRDLLVYTALLVDSPLVRLSATASGLGSRETAGWFVIARFADDTIATIEVSAVLPDAEEANGELMVEVTGSDAVLRAEPERQSVVINGIEGYQSQAWYAEPSESLLSSALTILQQDRAESHVSAMRLLQSRVDAANSARAVSNFS